MKGFDTCSKTSITQKKARIGKGCQESLSVPTCSCWMASLIPEKNSVTFGWIGSLEIWEGSEKAQNVLKGLLKLVKSRKNAEFESKGRVNKTSQSKHIKE